jgi:eukaryotic-like serine/threonine-protein kinase
VIRGLIAAAVVALAVAALLVLRSRRPLKLTERDPIVLTDFANGTGDAVFDDTLRQGLIVQLEQSPYLNVDRTRTIRIFGLIGRR